MPETVHTWTKPEIQHLIADLIGIREELVKKGQRTEATTIGQAIVLLDILAERRKVA